MRRTLLCRQIVLVAFASLGFANMRAVAQTGQPAQPLPQLQPRVARVQPLAPPATLGAPLAQVQPLGASRPGQPGPTTQQQLPLGPPFQLSVVEKQFVDQILLMWENESAKIKTFKSRFELWEYDRTWGPKKQDSWGPNVEAPPVTKSVGQLSYAKPDKGSFKIDKILRYKPKNPLAVPKMEDWVLQKEEIGAHWVCDGKAYFEYLPEKEQLLVTPMPPKREGATTVDGPVPFLFGAKAADLNRRYWIRSKQSNPTTICLEAYPREQRDAVNYHHVEIMLDRKTMQPKAIQVHSPNNKDRKVYMFDKPTINGRFDAMFGSLFSAPRTPFGWKRIVRSLPTGTQATPQAIIPKMSQHK